MTVLTKILKTIDSMSELSGSVGKWFALLLVLAGSYDAIARHFFNAPTIWAYDVLTMSGGIIYLLGASYNYLHDAHTRVDIIYGALSRRKQAWIDTISSLFLFYPLMIVMFLQAVKWSVKAWKIHEVMFTSFWYPPAAPYRTIFALGLFLLILQGISRLVRDVYFIMRGVEID
jgi:TRAP-type mannitol/chloroaromatic compound transport system permease small subunit